VRTRPGGSFAQAHENAERLSNTMTAIAGYTARLEDGMPFVKEAVLTHEIRIELTQLVAIAEDLRADLEAFG
jgi:hypothetical protein